MGVGGQRHAPAALAPVKRPSIHSIGDWMCCRAGLGGFGTARLHRDLMSGLAGRG
jgi:hypothetical protein